MQNYGGHAEQHFVMSNNFKKGGICIKKANLAKDVCFQQSHAAKRLLQPAATGNKYLKIRCRVLVAIRSTVL